MQRRLMMKIPRVEQYAHQSRADVFADRRISISLLSHSGDLAPHRSDAQLHIVTDNKAESVEIGSTLFQEDVRVLTQSGRGQVGCSGPQHLCHIC